MNKADTKADFDVVTGAFGYTGRYIARNLLDLGRRRVCALTGRSPASLERADPFGGQVHPMPFNFDQPQALVETLRGADTLYNTYWVRFASGAITFDQAVENSRVLIQAAEQAGVRRLVHISITNPSVDSRLPYFHGKALVEQAVRESRLAYAIIRPALVFGEGDILLNNIAWLLRRFPVFAVAGDGQYLAQPVCVEDLAELAVTVGLGPESVTIDAVGPETYTFEDLVRLVAAAMGRPARIVHLPPEIVLSLSKALGLLVRDVPLTRDEIDGLSTNLLTSADPPQCATRLSQWLSEKGGGLGLSYASELARHYRGR